MIAKVLGLLAVPLAYVAYSSLSKASPKTGPSFTQTGKSGTVWRVVRVSQFQRPEGLQTIHDIFSGPNRVLRYSQQGSDVGSRKFVVTPLAKTDPLLIKAASDFGVVLPKV